MPKYSKHNCLKLQKKREVCQLANLESFHLDSVFWRILQGWRSNGISDFRNDLSRMSQIWHLGKWRVATQAQPRTEHHWWVAAVVSTLCDPCMDSAVMESRPEILMVFTLLGKSSSKWTGLTCEPIRSDPGLGAIMFCQVTRVPIV